MSYYNNRMEVSMTAIRSMWLLFTVLSIPLATIGHAQVISMRTGIKGGIIACNYDPDDGSNVFTGTGMHAGFGMGTDIVHLIGFDLTPQYRTIQHSRMESTGERTYFYHNIYFPVFLSLKAGMLPRVSPYIGLGIGFNIIIGGHERFTYPNGTSIETPLAGSSTQGVIILGGGMEIKLNKLHLIPEFTANLSGTGDEVNPPQTLQSDYHFSLGVYYAP